MNENRKLRFAEHHVGFSRKPTHILSVAPQVGSPQRLPELNLKLGASAPVASHRTRNCLRDYQCLTKRIDAVTVVLAHPDFTQKNMTTLFDFEVYLPPSDIEHFADKMQDQSCVLKGKNVFVESWDQSQPIISAIDLFCGAGGLTRGLLNVGINVTAGYDIDPSCKYPYESNNQPAVFYSKSVVGLEGEELRTKYPENCIKVLVGCAPCQPFSTYTQGKPKSEDERWPLLNEFSRLVKELSPDVVSMENVPGIEEQSVFSTFKEELENQGYFVSVNRVFCPDYGIPQLRKRLVVLASKFGEIALLPPSHTKENYETVRGAIGNLPAIEAGTQDSGDSLHRSATLSKKNLERILASTPGGTWREWPKQLRAACHESEKGRTYGSVYGRMNWDEPSPTITTQFYGYGSGRFGHPDQARAISVREAAILQTFPVGYQFIDPLEKFSMKKVGKMIGNAVPVKLGEVIGRSIIIHLRKINE